MDTNKHEDLGESTEKLNKQNASQTSAILLKKFKATRNLKR